jgi:hypothetical protein
VVGVRCRGCIGVCERVVVRAWASVRVRHWRRICMRPGVAVWFIVRVGEKYSYRVRHWA